MDMNLHNAFADSGTDIMELCNALPDLDATEDIKIDLLPDFGNPLLASGPSGGSDCYGDLPSPELMHRTYSGGSDGSSTPDEQMQDCPPSPQMSIPSSPERDDTDDEPARPRQPVVWSSVGAPPARIPPHGGKFTFSDIEARRLERLNKNKKAAQALRRRKKQYLQQADQDLRKLKGQNTLLRNKVSSLMAENDVLRKENTFYGGLFSSRKAGNGATPLRRPVGVAGRVALGIMAATMVVTLSYNAVANPAAQPGMAISSAGVVSGSHLPQGAFQPTAQRRMLSTEDEDSNHLLVSVPVQQPAVEGGASALLLPCSEQTATAIVGASAAGGAALALPCSMGDGTIKVNDDVGTLLSLLQQQIRATNNGTDIALDWTELAKVGSAFYNDRTYLFSPHGAGLLDGQAWDEITLSSGIFGGNDTAEGSAILRKSNAFPAQAQAMAVARVHAVLESLSDIETFFLRRILAYERDGVVDFEGMQQETVDWTVMADANAALSILVPTPDDEMGVIVLDCVVRGARRWTLPMPIGEAASV